MNLTNYTCEEDSICTNIQSAICLHCNRRLCLQHITEHNQIIPSNVENVYNEIETTLKEINDDYERSRDTYSDAFITLNQWRTQEIEKIGQIYEHRLKCIENQEKALNILHQESTEVLDHSLRRQLQLSQCQTNSIMTRLYQIHQKIKQAQYDNIQLKWNLPISLPSMDSKHLREYSPPRQNLKRKRTSRHEETNLKRKRSIDSSPSDFVDLRKLRSFRRLVEMFDNISSIEQSKIDIDMYLKQQRQQFQLPILVSSYLTAWHRKSELSEKILVLNEYLPTVKKHIEYHNCGVVVLLGIHAFFFNEKIEGNKEDMMTFLLQYFINHQCLTRNHVLHWYTNVDSNCYGNFDEAKKLTMPFINSFSITNTDTNMQQVSIDQSTIRETDVIQTKQEPSVFS